MKYAQQLRERGFTLLEVLVATFILTFGLLAVITMVDVSYNAGSLSRDMTTATELAQTMMDRITLESRSQNLPFSVNTDRLSTYNNSGGGAIVMDTNGANPALAPGLTAFQEWQPLVQRLLSNGRGVVNITLSDPSYASNHRVTVTVSWGALLTRRVTTETILPM